MPKGLLQGSSVLLVGHLKVFDSKSTYVCNELSPHGKKRVGTLDSGLRKADFNTVSLLSAGSQGLELRRMKKGGK